MSYDLNPLLKQCLTNQLKLPKKYLLVASYLVNGLMFVAASIVSQPILAATNLQVTIETLNTSRQGVVNTPADSHKDVEVTLASGYISVKSDQETSIFDFKTRRRIVLDNTTKTYVDYSLYDTVGYRVLEYKNREMLNSMLTAAKITSQPLSSVDNEHILSIPPHSPAKIDETENGGYSVFSIGDHQLARWSKKGVEVSSADAQLFTKFLRYSLGGHPQILSKLAAGNLIPNSLDFTFNEVWGTSNRSISIKDFRRVDSDTYDLSSYSRRKTVSSSDRIDERLDQAAILTTEAIEVAKMRNWEDAEIAFHDGQVLDALLGLIEWTLMTGRPMPLLSPQQSIQVRSDQSVQKLMVAMGAKSKETEEEAVKTLIDLRSQAPKKSYVLKIFEANYRRQLGDPGSATKLLLEVLQENLVLAGVYKDLGDLLLTQYDSPRAWRCWDVGRRLAPQFANFTPVNQFEKSLVAQYPEYF